MTAGTVKATAADGRRLWWTQPVVSFYPLWLALFAALGAATWLGLGERRGPPSPAVPAPTDLAAFLAWGVPVEMEENDDVINVTPRVSVDPRGGFLVADEREGQVRLYRPDGALARVIGRKGSGPGEFRSLSAAHRLPDGRIAAVEMGGRVSVFDSAGAKLLHVKQAPVAPLYSAEVLDARHLLFTGRRIGTGGTALVHVYNVETGAVTRSFMGIPRHPPEMAGGYAFAGTASAVARGDTVAAVFALSDSIYLFDSTGRDLGRIAIPFERFRRLDQPMPTSGGTLEAFRGWSETFSAISQLYWLHDGSMVVQYYDMKGVEPQWRLLHMDRAGQRRFEGIDTPRLLAAGGAGDELVFVHPAADAPNVWVPARLKP
ncbi:hypothetical protein [Longimicrobium sp.]|uniref:hypothetical protein n=1 Tax=Longimicrobium sp. TaxID=2029185 RepID=UPI003B3BD987